MCNPKESFRRIQSWSHLSSRKWVHWIFKPTVSMKLEEMSSGKLPSTRCQGKLADYAWLHYYLVWELCLSKIVPWLFLRSESLCIVFGSKINLSKNSFYCHNRNVLFGFNSVTYLKHARTLKHAPLFILFNIIYNLFIFSFTLPQFLQELFTGSPKAWTG